MTELKYDNLCHRAEMIVTQCKNNNSALAYEAAALINEMIEYQTHLEKQNDDMLKSIVHLEESCNDLIERYEFAPIGYLILNKDGLINDINLTACQLLGMKKKSLINRCFSRYIAVHDQILFSKYREKAHKENSLQSFELNLLRWNMPSFDAAVHCRPINNYKNEVKLLVVLTDVSEYKKIEEALHHERIKIAAIDRLRSLNEFMHGIAKEQDYNITLVKNYLYGCIRRIEAGNYQIEVILDVLKKTTLHAAGLTDIIQKRRSAIAKSIFRYEYADINAIIFRAIALLKHEISEFPVLIQYDPQHTFNLMKLDIHHIQQVLLSLARNAIESMRDSKIKEPKLLIETVITRESMLEISLLDNGPGINQQLLPKLFDTSLTTKSYGLGLGLIVCRAIIEKHGGQIYAHNNPSGGACFHFSLPYKGHAVGMPVLGTSTLSALNTV